MNLFDDTLFAYATGRISAIENRLLTPTKLEILDNSTSKDDILKILSDALYDTSDIDSEEAFEKMLAREKEKLYSLIHELSNGTGITDIFLLKNDYHNLKVLIKQEFLKNPVIDENRLFIESGSMHIDKLALLFVNRDFSSFSDIMKNAVLRAISHMQTHRNPQEVDIILDNALYSDMKWRADEIKNEYLSTLLSVMADLVNIKTFLRVKRLGKDTDFLKETLVDGGDISKQSFATIFKDSDESFYEMLRRTRYHSITDEKDVSMKSIEKRCNAFLMDYVSSARFISLGIAPIISYLLKKEDEISNVKIIMLRKEKSIWKSA